MTRAPHLVSVDGGGMTIGEKSVSHRPAVVDFFCYIVIYMYVNVFTFLFQLGLC